MLATADIFLFEEFRLDRQGEGLSRRIECGVFVPVPIGLRALDVLRVFVERPGKLVTKEEIMALRPGSNELHMTPPELPWARHRVIYASSASSAAASFRSAVSKPSLNQPLTRASNSRASFRRPCSPHNRARLIAVRSSHSFAF